MNIKEFRIALTVTDWEKSIQFFKEGLGLQPEEFWNDKGRGQLFLVGNGALEVFDPDYAAFVDDVEVGSRVSEKIRFAFEVTDLRETLQNALKNGATMVHEPVSTPWKDLNARIESPDGVQITLYQRSK